MFVIRRRQRNVVTISPNASLFEARERMRRHTIPQLPVTGEDGHLIRILSNTDVREAELPGALGRWPFWAKTQTAFPRERVWGSRGCATPAARAPSARRGRKTCAKRLCSRATTGAEASRRTGSGRGP